MAHQHNTCPVCHSTTGTDDSSVADALAAGCTVDDEGAILCPECSRQMAAELDAMLDAMLAAEVSL